MKTLSVYYVNSVACPITQWKIIIIVTVLHTIENQLSVAVSYKGRIVSYIRHELFHLIIVMDYIFKIGYFTYVVR